MDFNPSPGAADVRPAQRLHRPVRAALQRRLACRRAGGRLTAAVPRDLKALARRKGCGTCSCPRCAMTSPARACPTWTTRRWPKPWAACPGRPRCSTAAPLTPATSSCCTAFANPAQRTQWLQPLLHGQCRSAFAMSEPDVASSDPTNLQTTVRRGATPWCSTAASGSSPARAPAVPVAHRAVPQCRRR